MKDLYLFFDCFGVIYDEIAPIVLKDVYGETITKEIRSTIFPRLDNGDMTLKDGLKTIAEKYGGTYDDLAIRWEKQRHLREPMKDFLLNLDPSIRLVLVSNAPLGIVETLFANNGLSKRFDAIYSSSALRRHKPNQDFFEAVLKDLKPSPGATILFIDDNESNIQAGKRMGFETFLFQGEDALERLKSVIVSIQKEQNRVAL